MNGAALIPLCVSFLGVFVGVAIVVGADVKRDAVASFLLGVAILLTVFNMIAGGLVAVSGMAFLGLLKASMLLTGVFAVVGIGFGLVRGLRSARGNA